MLKTLEKNSLKKLKYIMLWEIVCFILVKSQLRRLPVFCLISKLFCDPSLLSLVTREESSSGGAGGEQGLAVGLGWKYCLPKTRPDSFKTYLIFEKHSRWRWKAELRLPPGTKLLFTLHWCVKCWLWVTVRRHHCTLYILLYILSTDSM